MAESNSNTQNKKWHHPSDVMKLNKLKMKKSALQARIVSSNVKKHHIQDAPEANFNHIFENRRKTHVPVTNEPSGDALLSILQETCRSSLSEANLLECKTFFNKTDDNDEVMMVKAQGKDAFPVDWALKSKIRLWSLQPFSWNQKLKVCEEASGTTGFVRCLDNDTAIDLDLSPNSKFHQCCFYWQEPSLPWLSLFPRTRSQGESSTNIIMKPIVKSSLQEAWKDSLRSLFQLLRTKQCSYFYVCANNCTILFRAAGISGFSNMNALITPTTKGFRDMLEQEGIKFSMPLLEEPFRENGVDTASDTFEKQEGSDENLLQSIGIDHNDMKQINYIKMSAADKIKYEPDNSEQSLVLVEDMELHALYNFLINCKSVTGVTGHLAGIPPTILAPIAFNGATLKVLKVIESKVYVDESTYYTLEISGPILPSTIHNLFSNNLSRNSISATFVNVKSTLAFSKITCKEHNTAGVSDGYNVFEKENLADCGLQSKVLERFCRSDIPISNIECLKYSADSKTYTWT